MNLKPPLTVEGLHEQHKFDPRELESSMLQDLRVVRP